MHLELGTGCILYWHLLQIARESYHLRHLELNYDLPPANFGFKPLLERVHKAQQQNGGNSEFPKKLPQTPEPPQRQLLWPWCSACKATLQQA